MKRPILQPARVVVLLLILAASILFFIVPVQAQQDAELPSMGGGGGSPFLARCPQDQYLAGFRLRVGDDIDAIRPICATFTVETEITTYYVWGVPQEAKRYKYGAGPLVPYSSIFGGPGGHDQDLLCPSEYPIVTGMHIEIEGRNTQTVNSIQLFCWGGEGSRISRDCAPDGIPVKALCPDQDPAAEFKAPELWSVFPRIHIGFAEDEQHCRGAVKKPYVEAPQIYDSRSGVFVRGGVGYQPEPEPGLVAVGINGRSGIWLDAVGLICGELNVTKPPVIGTTSSALSIPPPQFIGTFAKTPANYQPMWVYAIKNDGDLLWYRKDSGESAWQGPKKVGNGWAAGYKDAIPAGGNSIYLLSDDGKLFWYQHTGFNDGTLNWKARVEIGHGWGFKKIFSGGEGIIYAIKEDGDLLWYKHGGYADGGGPGTWTGGQSVGANWNGFKDVFSNGGGDIYAVTPQGELVYYHQPGYAIGERRFLPARTLATGWQNFRQIIPAGDGVILAIKEDGKLLWYRHYFKATGTVRLSRVKEHWEGPVEIGSGWLGFKKVIALLPVAASAPVVR